MCWTKAVGRKTKRFVMKWRTAYSIIGYLENRETFRLLRSTRQRTEQFCLWECALRVSSNCCERSEALTVSKARKQAGMAHEIH